MSLKTLTYTSWASPALQPEDVDSILAASLANNARDVITGLLCFNGGNFLQTIEGAEHAIDDLVARLRVDLRHSGMVIRDERPIEVRIFPDWSMGFLQLRDGRFEGMAAVVAAIYRGISPPIGDLIQAMAVTMDFDDWR